MVTAQEIMGKRGDSCRLSEQNHKMWPRVDSLLSHGAKTDVIPFQDYTLGWITMLNHKLTEKERSQKKKKCMQYVGVYTVWARLGQSSMKYWQYDWCILNIMNKDYMFSNRMHFVSIECS